MMENSNLPIINNPKQMFKNKCNKKICIYQTKNSNIKNK